MTNAAPFPDDAALAAAAQWRARLDSDDAGEADWLGYETWLAQSPSHRAAADAIDLGLADVEAHREAISRSAPPPTNITPFLSRVAARPSRWIAAATALAACAVLLVVTRAPEVREFAYAAPATSDRLVTLADGSRLHLNRGAAVRVRFGRERQVDLAEGEASFEVVHDSARPFVVAAGDTIIRDVGTEFNVAANAGSLVVTVRSGEVALSAAGGDAHVRAGEQARVTGGTISVAPARADDAFSWQQGRLVYHAASLSAVVEDLNRYSETPISIEGDAANALQFTGVLVIDDPQAMLARLQAFLPIEAQREGERIVVRSQS